MVNAYTANRAQASGRLENRSKLALYVQRLSGERMWVSSIASKALRCKGYKQPTAVAETAANADERALWKRDIEHVDLDEEFTRTGEEPSSPARPVHKCDGEQAARGGARLCQPARSTEAIGGGPQLRDMAAVNANHALLLYKFQGCQHSLLIAENIPEEIVVLLPARSA